MSGAEEDYYDDIAEEDYEDEYEGEPELEYEEPEDEAKIDFSTYENMAQSIMASYPHLKEHYEKYRKRLNGEEDFTDEEKGMYLAMSEQFWK